MTRERIERQEKRGLAKQSETRNS